MNSDVDVSAYKRPVLPIRLILTMKSIVFGTFFNQTALASVLVLGWLMTLMRRHALIMSGIDVGTEDQPRWIIGPPGKGWFTRIFGGFIMNARRGFGAAFYLWIATFPFSVFWLVAWWAGWENSFNKGYEQAFVGPLVGILGIAVFAVFMIYLPMALVHQAVEQRPYAFFELRRIRNVVTHTGWHYVFWAAFTVILALPIFASRGLPAFAENIYPDIMYMTSEDITSLRNVINLFVASYVFVTLVIMKRWSARIYAAAARRAIGAGNTLLWQNSVMITAANNTSYKSPNRIGRLIRFLCLFSVWTALAILIFVGQFLNHEWHVWLTHPYVFLPWGMS